MYKITLTCLSPQQLICRPGAVMVTQKEMLHDLQEFLQLMPPGSEDSPVIQMEVEEVNPSQNAATKMPCSTKEQCLKNTMYATLPDMGEAVECKHEHWYDVGMGYKTCAKCGLRTQY